MAFSLESHRERLTENHQVKKKPGKKRTKIREVKGMRERMKNEEKEETGWPILDCRAGRLFHRPFWPTSSPAVISLTFS
jgi:hypothetical protein